MLGLAPEMPSTLADTRSHSWATVRIRILPPAAASTSRAELADRADRLEAMGAVLALTATVSGVESRDASTLEHPERPELLIYTIPAHLGRVERQARELGASMGLELRIDGETRTDDDWHDTWKRFYAPIVLGDGALLVRPSWIDRRPEDPPREIVLDPGRAFGTGLHASTRLCLDRASALFDAGLPSPARVLDLGCGSGILALACARLFSPTTRVVAVDTDAEATATTTENAERNALADRLETITGDLRAVPASTSFDLVFANIRPDVLVPLAPRLVRRLSPGGKLTLSGLLNEEADEVAAAYAAVGLVPDEDAKGGRRERESWTALDLRKSTP